MNVVHVARFFAPNFTADAVHPVLDAAAAQHAVAVEHAPAAAEASAETPAKRVLHCRGPDAPLHPVEGRELKSGMTKTRAVLCSPYISDTPVNSLCFFITDMSLLEYVQGCVAHYEAEVPPCNRDFIVPDDLTTLAGDEVAMLEELKLSDIRNLA